MQLPMSKINSFEYYIETARLSEKVKHFFKDKVSSLVTNNFIITDAGKDSDKRFHVWSLADKHPRIVASGGEFDLYKLMERFYVDKKDVFDEKEMLRFIKE